MAKRHKAKVSVVKGDDLLAKNFPMIHAVGRASDKAPRLVDMIWGDKNAPKVTLVGKGVCFDTGGLDIKPSSGMLLMKKDMGGAANVLGLASMIMASGLKVRLRVLIPAVENAISGNAFRPGDILKSRKGLTVEIGNTDAEGRLILADALALADEEAPEILVDMATLTGAARVALGPDLPPFYTDDDGFASDLAVGRQGAGGPALAHAAVASLRRQAVVQGGRHEQRDHRRLRRLDHGGAVPAALCGEGEKLGAFRHFRLEPLRPAARPDRRRSARNSRAGEGDLGALSVVRLGLDSMSKAALIFWGGWEGHTPARSADIVKELLTGHGFDVTLEQGTQALADPKISQLDLIVPVITMSTIGKPELENLTSAVRRGTGLAGFHGTMCDSFRNEPEYQFMTGGQWVSHPGNIIDYRVDIAKPGDPIVAGIGGFAYRSEQYYMHVDPTNEVLATTTFSGEHLDFIDGVVMPVVWKRQYGKGRVFYSALGHTADEFAVPQMRTIFERGALWASRTEIS